jgi:hypothetical protein
MFCGLSIHRLILVHVCVLFYFDFVGFKNFGRALNVPTMHLTNVIVCMRSFSGSKYDIVVVGTY